MKKFVNYLILALLMYIGLVAYCNNGVFDFVKEWESLKKTFNSVVEFFKGSVEEVKEHEKYITLENVE